MAIAAEEPSEQVKRMDAAATVLDEVMGTPDKGIPVVSAMTATRQFGSPDRMPVIGKSKTV